MTSPLRLLAILLGLSFCIQFASAQDRMATAVVLESQTVHPGDTIGVAVVMDLQATWHVYPGKGSPDEMAGYIATEVALTLPGKWNVGPTQWPGVHEMLFGFPGAEELIKVYEGRAIAYIPVTIPSDATDQEIIVAANVKYQACDDKICEMPTESNAETTLTIVEASTPITATTDTEHAKVFAGYTPPPSSAGNSNDNADSQSDDEVYRVALSLDFEAAKLLPGDQLGLAVTLNIMDTWHIQPGVGTGIEADYHSSLTFSLPNGWEVSKVQWPDAVQVPAPGGGPTGNEVVAAYEGTIVALVGITLPAELEAGNYNLKASLDYQACDASICEGPITVSAASTIEVVTQGTAVPNQPATVAALFKNFDRTKAFTKAAGDDEAGADADSTDGFEFGWKEARWISLAILITIAMLFMIVQTCRITSRIGLIISIGVVAIVLSVVGWAFSLSALKPHGDPFTQSAFDEAPESLNLGSGPIDFRLAA